jgi:hypothetical protein
MEQEEFAWRNEHPSLEGKTEDGFQEGRERVKKKKVTSL